MYHLLSLKTMEKSFDELKYAFAWILWHLWKNRNKLLFEGYSLSPDILVQKALELSAFAGYFCTSKIDLVASSCR